MGSSSLRRLNQDTHASGTGSNGPFDFQGSGYPTPPLKVPRNPSGYPLEGAIRVCTETKFT